MGKMTLAIYRLPTLKAAQIGHVRVVIDRNRQVYLAGSRVVAATPSGDFLIVTLANDQVYYVRARDYAEVQASGRARGERTGRREGG